MTNTELAEWLNQTAELSGRDRVTANVIRQWVNWDVLARAAAKGRAVGLNPDWSRPHSATRRSRRLADLRRADVRRENAIIVQAYLEWGHPDFPRVRSALLSEFRKWRDQLIRRKVTFLRGTPFATVSAAQLRAIANQNGPLDKRFVGTPFQQSKEAYAVVADAMSRSETDLADLIRITTGAFERIDREIADSMPPQCIAAIANSFSGLTGLESEIANSGETLIQKASERQFRVARHRVRKFRKVTEIAGHINTSDNSKAALFQELSLLGPQITVGKWMILFFVQALKFELSASK